MENGQSHHPSVKAICVNTIDPWTNSSCEELHINGVYTPEFMVIERSCSFLCLKEQPGKRYNSVMFTYQVGEGDVIDLTKALARLVTKMYGDYLYNELLLTGIWQAYIQFDDNPVNTVPEKSKYRIIRFGTFDLVNKREDLREEQ